jgi:hypothetical protein
MQVLRLQFRNLIELKIIILQIFHCNMDTGDAYVRLPMIHKPTYRERQFILVRAFHLVCLHIHHSNIRTSKLPVPTW